MNKIHLSLRAKLLIVSAAALIMTVLVLISFNYFSMHTNFMNLYKSIQNRVTDNIAAILGKDFDGYTSGITMLAKSMNGSTPEYLVRRYKTAFEETKNTLGVSNIMAAFDDGTFYSVNDLKLGADYDHRVRDWYKNGLNYNGVFVSKAYTDQVRPDVLCITISHPITAENGVKGLITFDVYLDFTELYKKMANSAVEGKFYLVESDTRIISASESDILTKRADSVFAKELGDFLKGVINGSVSSDSYVSYISRSGDTRMATVYKIPDYDLYIFYTISSSLVTKQIRTVALKSTVFGLILLAVSLFIVLFILRISLNSLTVFQQQITKAAEGRDLTTRIEGIAKVDDYNDDAKTNQQLEISAKVSDTAEAKTLAEKHLRLHNKMNRTASFTLPGSPELVAGVTVQLEHWGGWSGKYIVKKATHKVDSSGCTTKVELRRVLSGY